jgi:hypothetical protein
VRASRSPIAVAPWRSSCRCREADRCFTSAPSAISLWLWLARSCPWGAEAVRRGLDVLTGIDVIRINDRVLDAAGSLQPAELCSLDAIHLATAQLLGADLARIITYDEGMADAAASLGRSVVAPG